MTEESFCQSCKQKNTCKGAYEKIGNFKGPSVTYRVILALVVPLIAFIVSLVVFDLILAGMIETKGLRTALIFLLALSVTLIIVLITRATNRPSKKKRT